MKMIELFVSLFLYIKIDSLLESTTRYITTNFFFFFFFFFFFN